MGRSKRTSRTRVRLVDALFSSTQQKVLGLFFCFPDRKYTSSELVNLARAGTGAVHRELERLVASGLVVATELGKRRIYQANRNAPIFGELHDLLVKTVGVVDPIREALLPLSARIARAFIYGSVAKGVEHAGSDVDLMIVADDLRLDEVLASLQGAERRIGRQINPTIYTRAEFDHRIAEHHPFLTRIMSDNRIELLDHGASTTR